MVDRENIREVALTRRRQGVKGGVGGGGVKEGGRSEREGG